ncbi:MAG: SMI1/KNR4 family protein [Chloroflexota bacterium]
MTDSSLDDLIVRLQVRAADPERRVDVRQNVFSQNVMSLDLGGLLSMLPGAASDLKRVVAANQAGLPIDPDLRAKADQLEHEMRMPADSTLPPPADPAAIARAEAALGVPLPPALRRVYAEVADGGFGPGGGMRSLDAVVSRYREYVAETPGPRGSHWPEGLLPVVDRDIGDDCVEARSGRVIAWDPEELREYSRDSAWQASFQEIAPSIEAWLEEWVGSRTLEERMAERTASSMVEEARKARAVIAAKTPEERRAMGLPDVGWERVVWGGLGLDEDDAAG